MPKIGKQSITPARRRAATVPVASSISFNSPVAALIDAARRCAVGCGTPEGDYWSESGYEFRKKVHANMVPAFGSITAGMAGPVADILLAQLEADSSAVTQDDEPLWWAAHALIDFAKWGSAATACDAEMRASWLAASDQVDDDGCSIIAAIANDIYYMRSGALGETWKGKPGDAAALTFAAFAVPGREPAGD